MLRCRPSGAVRLSFCVVVILTIVMVAVVRIAALRVVLIRAAPLVISVGIIILVVVVVVGFVFVEICYGCENVQICCCSGVAILRLLLLLLLPTFQVPVLGAIFIPAAMAVHLDEAVNGPMKRALPC